jgi:hypothetical protein
MVTSLKISFNPIGLTTMVRSGHTAALLPSRQVLIAGGDGAGDVAWTELYAP